MTISLILAVKGRQILTLRAIWHLNQIKAPWPIIVADGAPTDALGRIVQSRAHFPNLSLRYLHAPDDGRAGSFARRVLAALDLSKTPYSQMVANDDYIVVDGLRDLAAFLDANRDHAIAGGLTPGFSIVPSETGGPFDRIQGPPADWLIMYGPMTATQAAFEDRAHAHLTNYFPTYYHLHRSESLRQGFAFLAKEGRDFRDFGFLELGHSLSTLRTGKMTVLPNVIAYMRQLNIASAGDTMLPFAKLVLSPSWARQGKAFFDGLSRVAEKDRAAWRERLVDGFGIFVTRVVDGSVFHGRSPADVRTVLDYLPSYGGGRRVLDLMSQGVEAATQASNSRSFQDFVQKSGLLGQD